MYARMSVCLSACERAHVHVLIFLRRTWKDCAFLLWCEQRDWYGKNSTRVEKQSLNN